MAANTFRHDFKVLQAVYFLPSPTRNEIARYTGRSAVSVTEILSRLVDKSLVEPAGKTQSRSGRPSATYRLGQAVGYMVGISLSPDSIRCVALDPQGHSVREVEQALALSADPGSHLKDILGSVTAEVRRFIEEVQKSGFLVRSVGVSAPGMVDTERGTWLHGLQVSGIEHVALGPLLQEKFGLPVLVEDVARCLAFLEASRRPPDSARDLVYLYLGDGVGAGIVIGGEPYHGSHGMAGEVGHLAVEKEGARCTCGNIGCLETVTSSAAILQRFRQRIAEGVISSLQKYRDGNGLSLEAIREAASAGDRLATSTLFEVGTLLGDAVSKIIKLYNPRTIVVGGPAAMLGDYLREAMWISVRQKVIPEMTVDLSVEIRASNRLDEATGGALLAGRRFWREGDVRSFDS